MRRTSEFQLIAWLGALLLGSHCFATTVVTLVTTHGIVVCADGKITQELNKLDPRVPPKGVGSVAGSKVFLIKNRFTISHAGLRGVYKNAPYSVDRMIRELQRDVSPALTMAKIADLIRDKLAAQFDGFDIHLKSGRFRREHLSPPGDEITRFIIAGYDGQTPHIYAITIGIDWKRLAVTPPVAQSRYPQPQRKNLTQYIVGSTIGISELFDIKSATYARERKAMPVEIDALVADRDLDIAGMARLARRMVALEIEYHPQTVGYPIKLITMPKGGPITTKAYEK